MKNFINGEKVFCTARCTFFTSYLYVQCGTIKKKYPKWLNFIFNIIFCFGCEENSSYYLVESIDGYRYIYPSGCINNLDRSINFYGSFCDKECTDEVQKPYNTEIGVWVYQMRKFKNS